MGNNSYIWCEKYRPHSLSTFLGSDDIKLKAKQWIEERDIPHLLFVGDPGTGKTTLSKILINTIECDSKVINASDESGIDAVRGKIMDFASMQGFTPRKICVLDEFDGFSRQGQEALRNLMEEHSDLTRFILTANHMERVIPPIISRTQTFQFITPAKIEVAKHVVNILKQEHITFELADVKLIIDAFYPDIRKIINELQLAVQFPDPHTFDKIIVVNKLGMTSDSYKLKLIELLKSKNTVKNKIQNIRQLLADNHITDYIDVWKLLYEKVDEYAPQSISQVILHIAEGQYREAHVADREINAAATLINIVEAIDNVQKP